MAVRDGGGHEQSLDWPPFIVHFSGNLQRKWPKHRKPASGSERLNST